MSTDAALFERTSQTFCYYDRWTNVTAFDWGKEAVQIEKALHHGDPSASTIDEPWVSAQDALIWIAAIEAHEQAEEEPDNLFWIRKVLAFVRLYPQGAFRIFYDHEEDFFTLTTAGYHAWKGYSEESTP